MWPNGLELRKTTLGAGRNYESSDLRPDEELIEALFCWDGKVGCPLAYIPAERPVFGREAYIQEARALARALYVDEICSWLGNSEPVTNRKVANKPPSV